MNRHNLLHAGNFHRRRRIARNELASEIRTAGDDGVQHSRAPYIQPVSGAAGDDRLAVGALNRLTNQVKVFDIFELRLRRRGKLCRSRRQLAERQFTAGRNVDDLTMLGATALWIDLPLLSCGTDQHLSRRGRSCTQWVPRSRGTPATAGAKTNAFETRLLAGLLDDNLFPVGAQLISQDHG